MPDLTRLRQCASALVQGMTGLSVLYSRGRRPCTQCGGITYSHRLSRATARLAIFNVDNKEDPWTFSCENEGCGGAQPLLLSSCLE